MTIKKTLKNLKLDFMLTMVLIVRLHFKMQSKL